ncbi:MAG: hypothetical protein HKP61_03470 [Dactylosporangium sp.]|nr:hypothetical protein [Dactylosporangium sp.]NNJ60013.1 hypothetical protein [Dactylosporangium sp.]
MTTYQTRMPPASLRMTAAEAMAGWLRESALFRLSVDLYRSHRAAEPGPCPRCGVPMPCAVRRRAITVITAADIDSRTCDQDGQDNAAPAAEPPSQPLEAGVPPGVRAGGREICGFAVGGLGRRANVPEFPYER